MKSRTTFDFFLYFARAYPARTITMVGLLILGGFAEGIGVVALLPLLEAVQGTHGEEASGAGAAVVHVLRAINVEPTIGTLLVVVVLATTLSAVFVWIAMRQVGFTVARVTADLRLALLERLATAEWRYFVGRRKGELANSISLEATRASMSYRESCSFLAAGFEALIYGALAFAISWQITVFAVASGTVLAIVLRRFIGISRAAGEEQTRLVRSLSARLLDVLNGMKSLRAMGKAQNLISLMRTEISGIHAAEQKSVLATHTLMLLQTPLVAAFLALGLYVLFTVSAAPLSTILVIAFLFNRMMGKINTLQQRYQGVVFGESSFWSLQSQIAAASSAQESDSAELPAPSLTRHVRLRDVTFGYSETPVLQHVNLEIQAGQFIAIVGASGAGKTTIADLVAGLYIPAAGSVQIDGVALQELSLNAWRAKIGYVPQETLLFHDTIANNVTLGDARISREAVKQALIAADAWSFVSRLENGLDHVIGESGGTLSGGQRQRISIARALVAKPELLILDEATTALDPATEAAICETLSRMKGAVTILAISHQNALREAADVVYHLENGAVRRARPTESVAGALLDAQTAQA